MLEAVLFDLEETLVVRESYQRDVDQVILNAVAQVRGCGISEARLVFQKMRRSFPTTTATLRAFGVPREELYARLDQVELSNPVVPKEGVPDVLHQLVTKGLRLGLVTNMPRGLTLAVLSSAGISRDLFIVMVTGSDTQWPKPALEPFMVALRLMALRSWRCMMVGDREDVDLDPAKRLGMKTVIVGSTAHRADHMLTSLSQLESLIARQYEGSPTTI